MNEHESEVARAYNSVAGTYDGHHVDAKSIAENHYIKRYLARRIKPGMNVVDMGCGTGLLLDLCPVRAGNYLGFDISDGMIEQAKRKYPNHRFIKGDMQALNKEISDGSADLVVSLFGSASYCDISKVQTEVRRMLKPGGSYFLMFCSPLYVERETYITRSTNLLIPYTKRKISDAFRPDEVWGMSKFVDKLPKQTPLSLMNALLSLEIATLGRAFQDSCYFINIWGTLRE